MQRKTCHVTGIDRRITFCLGVLFLVFSIFLEITYKPSHQNPSTYVNQTYPSQPLVAEITPKIYIDGLDASRDWDNCPWVNGSGSFIDPYIIHNISINGSNIGSCLIINNTQDYFKIENCSFFNAGYGIYDAGIRLLNVSNGILQKNNCSANRYNGILLSICKNNTISDNNCTRNYYYGISLYGSSNNTIDGNNCSVNYNHGIYIYSSSNNTIGENYCSENNDGIYISLGTNNTLEANICSRNYRWGIDIAGGSNTTLLGNLMEGDGVFYWGSVNSALTNSIDLSNLVNGKPVRFYANKTAISIPADTGQVLLSYCNDTEIQDFSTTGVLISFYSCFNNTIRRNNCSGYVNGIELWESSNNTIADNTCFGNNQDGIYLYNSFNNTLSENNCSENLFSGIHLQSSFNILERNNCSGNFFYGIYLEVSNNCTVKNNICKENHIGIIVDSSDESTFDGNTCQSNRYRGIYFSYSCNNTLKNNFCSDNEDGIYIGLTSHNNSLSGNNCSMNTERGIYLSASNNNSLSGNNCSRNLGHGIYLSNSNFTDVFQNLVKKNGQGHVTELNCSGNNIQNNNIILFPNVSFIASSITISAGQSITFTSTLTGGLAPHEYQWNFGDGTVNNTETNPSHLFVTPNTYTIILTVTDAEGDIDVYQISVTIQAPSAVDWALYLVIGTIGAIIVALGILINRQKGKATRSNNN